MKRFYYTASTQEGKKVKGSLLASNADEAAHLLKEEKKIPLRLKEERQGLMQILNAPAMSFQDRLMMTKHLATMIEAGITLTEAFETFAEQEKRKNNKKMYESILKSITSGQSLSISLREYPKIFTDVYTNMIAVGEESGTLPETLNYLDTQLEKEYDLRKKVLSAFIYPSVIVSITVLLTLGIVVFIIPKITSIFEALHADLPLPTRVMIAISTFLVEHPLQSLSIALALIGASIGLIRWKALKPFWHNLALHLPIMGKIFVNVNLARFSRNMFSLLRAGVSLTHGLEITEKMFTNHFYKTKVGEARIKVEQGSKLFEALKGDDRLFPGMAVKMIQIGEKTGKLEKAMEHLAVIYEREVDNLTRNLSVLLEPVLLVFMGAMVGSVALSVILPIYQIPNLIGR